MAAVDASPAQERLPVAVLQANADVRLVGVLVHRLIDRFGVTSPASDLGEAAAGLLRRDERLMTANPQATLAAAVRRYRTLVNRPDVRDLFDWGPAWHEVPVSAGEDGVILRGAIDTLVVGPGSASVLEFKTGRASEAHHRQLARYVAAATRFLPGISVKGVLVYVKDEED